MEPSSQGKPVLVATLGTQPQVVTLAVDLLDEAMGILVSDVYVIHTSGERVLAGIARLKAEFRNNTYRARPCRLHTELIQLPDGTAVEDIQDQSQANATFDTIFRVVKERKQKLQTIHMSIAGGRNTMVVYGASVAQILFGPNDRLWHIISKEPLEKSGAMHAATSKQAILAPIPVRPLTTFLEVALHTLSEQSNPYEMIRKIIQQDELDADRRRKEFLRDLTPRERQVLVSFVRRGETDQQMSARFSVSPRVISSHMGHIYDKMRVFFSDEARQVDANRTSLAIWFAGFFDRYPELETPPD